MRIVLHIGPEEVSASRIQSVLAANRDALDAQAVRFASSVGNKNHTRLFMAVTDPGHVDPLRFNRGFVTPEKQATLRVQVARDLAAEIAAHRPDTLILSCTQLAGLRSQSELARLRALLSPLSDDIRVLGHVDHPTAMLARAYEAQILEGRGLSLAAELELVGCKNWWNAALEATPPIDPAAGVFAETQAPVHWIDLPALAAFWREGFDHIDLRNYDPDLFASATVSTEITAAFGLAPGLPPAQPIVVPPPVSEATLARGRQLNALLLKVLASRQRLLPRQLWRSLVQEVAVDGPPLDRATLHPIAKHFEPGLKKLIRAHDGLNPDSFKAPRAKGSWAEANPKYGYRASQYLLGFMWRIDKATREEHHKKAAALAELASSPAHTSDAAPSPPRPAPGRAEDDAPDGLSASARRLMPPLAVEKFETLRRSSFAPHNRMGSVNEEALAAAYAPITPRVLPEGNSGNVIVGCMKNEAPYILEWVAYHRAMGIDNFLIYTNGCEDGTSEILDRLQQMGILEHRNNDGWKGNSPQQYALNQALKEPVIRNAEWIIHIDVDEFMNVRCGNGTVQDFLDAVPDATNVAMTWRLFGHNGVTALSDDFVIEQFDTCAPKYCPKPHTVWGFKTMFRNIGAYEKISCHRPNKLDEAFEDKVKWVNGSGQDMTRDVAKNGWRSSKSNVGYDLLQLNHYALRSAESFLIKRQRGRALHVDRSIGINYWIRMDWSDFRDVTIKRNVPRLRAEYDRLLTDDTLRDWHERGLAWHRAKAAELHLTPEFADLYKEALAVKLTETERVAYALALDMES